MNTNPSTLGPAQFPNPLQGRRDHFIGAEARVLMASTVAELGDSPPQSFEQAGPRREIFFNPAEIACGIVTCGGLCPGLNDVIRAVTLTLTYSYGVKTIYGFRYGYAGVAQSQGIEPVLLTSEIVERIHEQGGTFLGSSRGPQEIGDMLEKLQRLNVKILFAVGGDGTLQGASLIAKEAMRRGLNISVVGIPKTIDNDLLWIERSFGFATAVEEATRALAAAHTEATGAFNGVGLVKLMGRHSGFITAQSTLANSDVNFCLVPEVEFDLEGFLNALTERLQQRHHALIAIAEGAGQDWMQTDGKDASGNKRLGDCGTFLKKAIEVHLATKGMEHTVKYIDPSYIIRSLAANALDSEYCLALGQHAVHAGISGRTDLMVGYWNQHFTHVPLELIVGKRRFLDPQGELWQRVLAATGQPSRM